MKPKPRRTSRPDLAKRAPGRSKGMEVNRTLQQNADALREAEKRCRMIVETANDGVWELDAQCRTTFANERLAVMLGCEVKDILGGSTEDFMFPEDVPAHVERIAGRRSGESGNYELRLRRKNGSECWALVSGSPVLDAQGRYAGSFAMLSDITERKRAERVLRESEEAYRTLAVNLPGLVYRCDLRQGGTMQFMNDLLVPMTGYRAEELHAGTICSIEPLISEPDRPGVVAEVERAIADDRPFTVEYRLTRKDGSERFFSERGRPVRGADGLPSHVDGVIFDVTESRQTDAALRESEEKYRNVVERANDGIIIVQDGMLKFANQRMAELDGTSVERLIGTPFTDHVHPDELPRLTEIYRRRMAGENVPHIYETVLQRADGSAAPSELNAGIVTFEGKPADMIVIRDITERKQADQALQESEERLRQAFEDSGVGKLLTGLDGRLLRVNRAFAAMLGYSVEELQSLNFQSVTHPEDVAENVEAMTRLQTGTEGSTRFQKRYLHKNGRVVWADVSAVVLRDDEGKPHHFVADVQDVTERKKAEQALRESEVRLHAVFDNSRDAISLSQDGLHLLVNPAYVRMFEFPNADGLIGTPTIERIAPSRRDQVQDNTDRRSRDEPAPSEYETRCIRQDGTEFEVEVSVSQYQIGTETYSLAMLRDITDRKRAEDTLQESEERFRRFSQTAPDAIVMADDEGHVDFWNEAAERMFGYTREVALGQALPELVAPPALRERFHAGLVSFARTGTGPFLGRLLQYDAIRRDGSEFPVELTMSAIQLQGRWHSIGTIHDITERKQAEERNRKNLETTTLLRDTAMGYVQLAPDADINQYVADGLSRILGEAYVIVNSYDEAEDQFTVRAVAGIGARIETVLTVMGQDPIGTVFTVANEHRTEYASEKLMKFEDGLRGLSYGKLPRILTQTIEKTFDIGGVYAMGFHWQGRVLGTVNLIMRRGAEIRDPVAVEAFVNQAAIALQHRRDAEELDRHRVHLEELVAERTRELTAAQEQLVLQEKLATLGRVAGSVAHELRNPLGAIRNASYFLQATAAPKLEGLPLRHLQIIDEYVERANKAITMILDFTQSRAVKPDLCTLRSILERAIAETDVPRTVKLSITIPNSLPQVLVDDCQVTVAFRNLLTNAVEAMPNGGTVKIQARAGQDVVAVDVTDTGAGIKPEHMESLFRPLFTTKIIGVGLGLAICKVFIEASKGTISVVSEVGKGTTFTITLPAPPHGQPCAV